MSLPGIKELIDRHATVEKFLLDENLDLREQRAKLNEKIERLKKALEKINLTTEPYSYAVAEEALKEVGGE